jgi:hypothetical protein
MTPEELMFKEFETRIRNITLEEGMKSYDNCADRFARLVLEHYEKYPEHRSLDANNTYSVVKLSCSVEDRNEILNNLTGFMVGWGVNAAKVILKIDPVPNPAIVEIK